MRKFLFFIVLTGLTIGVSPGACGAEAQVELKINDDGLKSFYLSVGEHYHAREADLVTVRERHVPDEELPVVFFLATKARVTPSTILDLRKKRLSWMDISLQFNLNAATYHVDAGEVSGSPFGHAYGHYKKHPKDRWSEIRLSDADIVNLVNLRFISEHYGYKPAEVIKLRKEGHNFVQINRTVEERKLGGTRKAFAADDESNNGKKDGKPKKSGKKK